MQYHLDNAMVQCGMRIMQCCYGNVAMYKNRWKTITPTYFRHAKPMFDFHNYGIQSRT